MVTLMWKGNAAVIKMRIYARARQMWRNLFEREEKAPIRLEWKLHCYSTPLDFPVNYRCY